MNSTKVESGFASGAERKYSNKIFLATFKHCDVRGSLQDVSFYLDASKSKCIEAVSFQVW